MTYVEKKKQLKNEYEARFAALNRQREAVRLEAEEQLADLIFLQRAEKVRYDAELLNLNDLERLEEKARIETERLEAERIEAIGKIVTFDFWNAVTQRKMQKYSPLPGTLNLDVFSDKVFFNIVGNPDRTVGSVRYEIDYRDTTDKVVLQKTQIENRAPHAVFAKDRTATLLIPFNLVPELCRYQPGHRR